MLWLGKPWHYSVVTLPTHTFLFSFIKCMVRKLSLHQQKRRAGRKDSQWPGGRPLQRQGLLPWGFLCCPWGVGSPQPAATLPEEWGRLERGHLKQSGTWPPPCTLVSTKWVFMKHWWYLMSSWTMSPQKTPKFVAPFSFHQAATI